MSHWFVGTVCTAGIKPCLAVAHGSGGCFSHVIVYACARVCMCMCVYDHVCVCVCVCVCVREVVNNMFCN